MPPHLHKSRERESLLASMERNYNIHCIMTKPDSYASFSSSVQAKHDQEDNGRDDQKEIMISKKKKQKKGSGDHNINGIRRKEVKLSTDPQSVAARERRHRISERFKIRQGLDPGGTKMDTVSMLEEAIQYVKFLKSQIWLHQAMLSFNQYLLGHHVPCHDDHHVFASSDHHSLSSPDNDHHLNIYG